MPLARWIDELRHDLTITLRQLLRSPAFTIVATLTLALGIGANSAIFALVDATLLRPLPFRDPGQLVMLWERTATTRQGFVSPPNLLDWRDRTRTFADMAAFAPGVGGMVMAGADGTAETVSRQWVTAGVFDVLGVQAIAGRTFLASEDRERANVVVISETFWRSRFGSDPTVVGRAIRLDGTPYTVVGVVPHTFQLRQRSSIWALAPLNRDARLRNAHVLQVVGRMKAGVAIDAARADLTAVADGLARELPETNKGRSATIDPLHNALIGRELRLTSLLFLAVVGVVLLICCANVANLLLARATVRTQELAIRSALGATRRRVVRQLLTESLLLSAIGGILGVGIGAAILSVAPSIVPRGLLPAAVTVSFDLRVVAFCAAAALIVGVLFGIAPAWQATDFSSAQAIGADGRTTTGRGGRLRGVLVAGEVATAVLLLFGAGLLLRTLVAVETIDPGYRADRVLTMMVDPLGARYPTAASLLQFFDAIEREVLALPGVRGAAWTTVLPLDGDVGGRYSFEIVGDQPDARQRPMAASQLVSPSYFSTMGIPVVAGRPFTDRDTADSVQVCLVNEAFARTHLGGRSPLGLRLALRPPNSPNAQPELKEIVGVARQVKVRPDETEELVQIYVPMAQDPTDDIYLAVAAASGRAEGLASSVRAAIAHVDKEQLASVRDVMTLDDVAWQATGRHRFRAVLVITFAGLALVLAMVGVFGILAYSVQQRLRDFAVRRALGATTTDVIRLVVGDAARVVVTGAIIGLLLSAALGRLLTTMLFGVEPWDPVTFACVTIVLALTAAVAITAPAWRATRIDPAVALRSK